VTVTLVSYILITMEQEARFIDVMLATTLTILVAASILPLA
jgi:hypothetical protein